MIRPASEAELAEQIAGQKTPLSLRGGGTRAPFYTAGELLDLRGLNGVSLYEPAALTLIAGAGTPLAQIGAMLAGEGQRLGFEPPDFTRLLGREGGSTLGGIASENASGPRRFQAGAARDHMIGLRFVDGNGVITRSGGRVMKNVTGYDLVKLLAGARGQLGVISEIAFRLQPLPETSATLVLHGATDPEALMARALASPFELCGAALLAGQPGAPFSLFLRLEGFAPSVSYRLQRLRDLLRGAAEIEEITDPAQSEALWRRIRDLEDFAAHALVISAAIRPARLAACRAALAEVEGHDVIIDQGGGLLHLALRAPEPGEAAAALQLLQDFCAGEGGHARLVKAPPGLWPLVSPRQPEAAGLRALSQALRAKFDPRGLFNSGAPL
nr:FAD-binding protein [Pseudogemmobacter faecipullorum]